MKYILEKIIDTNSQAKHPLARELIEKKLMLLNIEYIQDHIHHVYDGFKCANDVCCMKKGQHSKITVEEREEMCNTTIQDIFVLRETEGKGMSKYVGNTCIAAFILGDYLLNVDKSIFKEIKKILKTKNMCGLCGKTCTKTFHNKCVRGKSDVYVVDGKSVASRRKLHIELGIKNHINQVKGIFDNVVFVKNIKNHNTIDLSSLNALKKLTKEYKLIIENKDKLLELKNNSIINRIKKQQKKPTINQMIMIEKILGDYDRIKRIDIDDNDIIYKTYGFCYSNITF